jgi:predicted Zn-dependent peptidase
MNNLQKFEQDTPGSLIQLLMKRLLFQTKSSQSIYGDKKTLKNISVKDIKKFYQNFFHKKNLLISIASDLPPKKIIVLLNKHFKRISFKPIQQSPSYSLSGLSQNKTLFEKKNLKQTTIALGFPCKALSRSRYLKSQLLTNLLGGGIGSVLWELRAKHKLAYSINSKFITLQESGFILIKISTANQKRERAYRELIKIINNLILTGIDSKKLESIKNYTKLQFFKNNETKSDQAFNAGFFQQAGFGYQLIDQFGAEIDKISVQDLNQFLRSTMQNESRLKIIIGLALKNNNSF